MFLGSFEVSQTAPSRIVLPKKFREELKGQTEIVLSRGLDGGVWGYRVKDWRIEAKKQLEISITDQKGRDFRRLLFPFAEVVKLDKQGRFIIPSALSLLLGKRSKLILIGVGDHFEVWDRKHWQKMMVKLKVREG